MPRRRLGFWIVLVVISMLLATGLWVRQAWHSLLQANGIEQVDWQGFDLSLSALSINTFDVRQATPDRQIAAHGRGLSLTWQWRGAGIQVTSVTMNQLQIDLQSGPDPESTPSASPLLPDFSQEPPAWLPQRVTIEHLNVNLPCATGQCPLVGSFSTSRDAALLPLHVRLILDENSESRKNKSPGSGTHHIQLDANVNGAGRDAMNAVVNLAADGEQILTGKTEYRKADDRQTAHWTGTVNVPRLPQTGWILDWVSQWQPTLVESLPQQPDAADVNAKWALQWPSGTNVLKQISGSLKARANLPEPWLLPGLGTLQGNFEMGLKADQGRWLAQTAQSDLQLSQPAAWVTQLPESLRPETVSIRIQPAEPVSEAKADQSLLPITLKLTSRGQARIDITSHLAFATQAPWRVVLGQSRVQGNLPRYTVGDWQLEQPQVDLSFSGQADAESLKLTLAPDSQLQVNRVDNIETGTPLALNGLRADLSSLQVDAAYRASHSTLSRVSISGPLALEVRQIRYPQLKAQSWQFNGNLAATLKSLSLNGELETNSGAQAEIDLRYPFDAALTFSAQSRLSEKAGSDSWAGLLSAWPDNLEITKGMIVASANITRPQNGPVEMSGTLDIEDLDGTFDRMAWTGLDTYLTADMSEDMLTAATSDLSVGTINPGIPLGPVTLAGHYQASSNTPSAGKLVLKEASAGLLGGDVKIKPDTWDLSQQPLQIPLEINRVQLSRLMALYPAENLSGTGTLSGQVPVWVGHDGAHVVDGKVHALAPGGRLQLPGDRLKGLAQGNAAMETVTEAMKNFHYSVLNSTIDYAKDGTLGLGLHIEGNNPNVRAGQPVVLNINLEEDIPALLTSLQLSGRVNEAVTERVKKLIEKQQSGGGSELEIKGTSE